MDRTAASPEELELFAEFPPVTPQAWVDRITKDLKGADFEKKMIWRTDEGFALRPFYTAADLPAEAAPPGAPPFLRGYRRTSNAWQARADIREGDAAAANARALALLEHGADGVGFELALVGDRLSGVGVRDQAALQRLLQGIWIDQAQISFTANSAAAPGLLALYLNEAERQGKNPGALAGLFSFDPTHDLARSGSLFAAPAECYKLAADLARATEGAPGLRPLCASNRALHESGANTSTELAFALASAHEFLARLTEHGLSPARIASSLYLHFEIGSNYFMEIARLRAARLLWAKIAGEYAPGDAAAAQLFIHCESSRWNQTLYDPHVNMLRGTTEGMSAALGACESLSIAPFDQRSGEREDYGDRIALNTQHLLRYEAHLDKTVDPAAGSYYIETLTLALAESAWKHFQEIERAGGALAALEQGVVQAQVEPCRTKKTAAVAARRVTLLGTNQYPNQKDRMAGKLRAPTDVRLEPVAPADAGAALDAESPFAALRAAARGGAHLGRLAALVSRANSTRAAILPAFAGAAPFEALRLAAEAFEAKRGSPPRVFLFLWGDRAARSARSIFAQNFFGCAGYASTEEPAAESIAAGAELAVKSGSDIIVLCSSDAEYAEFAPAAARELAARNSRALLVVAGYPEAALADLKVAGIERFIHVRSNLLEELRGYHKLLGIEV